MQDFFGRAKAAPDRVVVVLAEQGRSYSAGALAQLAQQMAQWLAAQGLQAGERFAVLLENRVEILALVLAARQAGLYAAVLSTHLTPDEVAYIVADSGARLVVASAKTLPQLAALQASLLAALWPLLRPGGRMLYCTCSVFRAEGDGQIQAFLAHNTDAHLLPSPGHLLPGSPDKRQGLRDNGPGEHDGFFYALLYKTA